MFTLTLSLGANAAEQTQNTSHFPVFNVFELGIKQGMNSVYDEIASENITASVIHEKGTLAMYSIKQAADINTAYMVEIYADDVAYKKHLNSPQYKGFLKSSPSIIEANKKFKMATVPQFLGDKKFEQDDEMINNFVIVDVKPEFSQSFKDVVLPEMAQSLKVEDGVLAMYAAIDKGNTERWYFYEIYASGAAYEAHRNTSHFKDYLQQTANMTTYKEAISVTPSVLMNKGGLTFSVQ